MAHIPEGIEGLINTRRPAIGGGGLMQFLQAVSCMGTSLPGVATVAAPLHELLETLLARNKRTNTADEAQGCVGRR